MTDLAPTTISAIDSLPAGAVPGPTVRALVTWTESEIDQLLRQLDEAEQEATAAEREAERLSGTAPAAAPVPAPVAGPVPAPEPAGWGHPEIGWGHPEIGMTTGSVQPGLSSPSHPGAEPAPAYRPSPSTGPPRTTVVVRPRASDPTALAGVTPPGSPAMAGYAFPVDTSPVPAPGAVLYQPEGAPSHRPRRSGWFRTHLMMKAGVALVLVGLLLLKFG